MKTLLLALGIISGVCALSATGQVPDPMKDGSEPGRTYLKWSIDLNHDGVADVLVSAKPTQQETEDENEILRHAAFIDYSKPFAVYIGLQSGGYKKMLTFTDDETVTPAGGVIIDINKCFVGYVDEIQAFGIVVLEVKEIITSESRQNMERVRCFRVSGATMLGKSLTPWLEDSASTAIFQKYLVDSKRTTVTLQEVTP